jgi:flagellin-specific chaperone FliS
MEVDIKISSNRAAYILNKCTNLNVEKGSIVNCDVIVQVLLTNLCYESIKILLNEVIDVYTQEDFNAFYRDNPDRDIEKGKRLIRELISELNSGEWQKKEYEFDKLYEIYLHRIKIINSIC